MSSRHYWDEDLPNLKQAYPFLFSKRVSDSVWIYRIKDTLQNELLTFQNKSYNDIQILKYESGGFYKWHTDHFTNIPRTLSMLLFLNNDYEGGSLNFKNPDNSGEHEIKPAANRLVVWPSNFLYPHAATKVIKGTRFCIVSWVI